MQSRKPARAFASAVLLPCRAAVCASSCVTTASCSACAYTELAVAAATMRAATPSTTARDVAESSLTHSAKSSACSRATSAAWRAARRAAGESAGAQAAGRPDAASAWEASRSRSALKRRGEGSPAFAPAAFGLARETPPASPPPSVSALGRSTVACEADSSSEATSEEIPQLRLPAQAGREASRFRLKPVHEGGSVPSSLPD